MRLILANLVATITKLETKRGAEEKYYYKFSKRKFGREVAKAMVACRESQIGGEA